MNSAIALKATPAATQTAAAAARARMPDDVAMLKIAAEVARDLAPARPLVYWGDFLGSATLGYAALYGAVTLGGALAWAVGIVAVLALYRAMSFIHEVTHVKHAALPWFRFGYNAVIGVPMLIPSFMYEGIHSLHHARTRYGTKDDPEYLPLALMKPWTLPLFVLVAALAPIGLLIRFALLGPLSLLSRRLRAVVVARYSGLQINPSFQRRPPEGDFARQWRAQEIAASLWALALIGLVATGTLPVAAFLVILAVASAVAVLNQLRTLVAHLWENEGEPMTVTAQYLDSVNVPPPGVLPMLWAPVGLRYHALHHLLPSVPYHALGAAHRRLQAQLGPDTPYSRGHYAGLLPLVARIATKTMRGRRER